MASEITLANWRSVKGIDQYKAPDRITCVVCKEEKDKDDFVRCITSKVGRRTTCKKCENAKNKAKAKAKKEGNYLDGYFQY